jgi:hypothetical protein
MRTTTRRRRYVPSYALVIMRPLLRYSQTRDAYVLRIVGRRKGPVLRANRRQRRTPDAYSGPDRRQGIAHQGRIPA